LYHRAKVTDARGERPAAAPGQVSPADIAETLRHELARLDHADPFATLGLGYEADGDAIRAAFLKLTKVYHPSRYARMERDVFRLANEVFLRVKDAYTRLSHPATREQVRREHGPQAATAVEALGRAPTSPAPTTTAESAATRSRPSTQPPPTRAPARPTPAVTPPPAPDVAAAEAGKRTKRPSSEVVPDALRDTVRKRSEEFELALKLSRDGRLTEARQRLQKIAAEDPQNKKFRVHMHYLWGLEHEEAGQIENARAELLRVVKLDPEFKRAHEALDRLPGKKSIFSKLFGR
jgi:curved DNA-binding protein CbpA